MPQTLTILELQLEMKCLLLETPENCKEAIESLKKLTPYGDEEEQMIEDTKNIIWNRGNNLIVEGRV